MNVTAKKPTTNVVSSLVNVFIYLAIHQLLKKEFTDNQEKITNVSTN